MQFISQYRKELHASPSPVPRSHSESDPPERRTFACAQLWRQMTLCLARMWKPGCGRYAGGVNADAGLDSGAHRWNSIRAKGPEGKRQQQRILHVSPKVSCTLGCGRFLSGAPSPSPCLVGVFISITTELCALTCPLSMYGGLCHPVPDRYAKLISECRASGLVGLFPSLLSSPVSASIRYTL